MGNKQGSLGQHLETATRTGALAFPNKKLEAFPDDLNRVAANLRTLDLSGNRIVALPSTIENFKSLKTLNLGNNRLASLPPGLGKLTKLETLVLSGNRISFVPESFVNLKNLKDVNLSCNKLVRFPMVFCSLKKLDIIDLSANKITSVPSSDEDNAIESLQITELNLNQNQIAVVSKEIAKCQRLKTLRLDENCLTLEKLPVEILTSSVVSTLSVKGNLFTEKQLNEVEGFLAYLERYAAVKRKMD